MLDNKELIMIEGGATKITVGILIASLITFLAGVIDGYLRPMKCN